MKSTRKVTAPIHAVLHTYTIFRRGPRQTSNGVQVISRVQDTLIWVMKAEDFDDEEKMKGFQAMVRCTPALTNQIPLLLTRPIKFRYA